MRDGMNSDCRWPAESTRILDLRKGADQAHLRSDIEVAEELGVRYADHVADRQPVSILGVQFRARLTAGGGILQRLRERCSSQLFGDIEQIHHISSQQVAAERAQLANKGADLPVNVPMTGLFLLAATKCIFWIRGRFASDEKLARILAISLASLMVSASITLVGQLWAAIVEMVRLGNEHLSYRATRLSWRQHFVAVFVLAVVAFWVLAIIDLRIHGQRLSGNPNLREPLE